jgi:hypothetical protein
MTIDLFGAARQGDDVSKLVAFWLLGHGVIAKGRPFPRWYPYQCSCDDHDRGGFVERPSATEHFPFMQRGSVNSPDNRQSFDDRSFYLEVLEVRYLE